jgi:hypothetical protein
VINDDKINLPVCAFSAGLAHVAALALILPIVITLPAPADPAPRAVAIHVEIRMATAEPDMAEGDAEDAGAPLDALGSEEVTAALPAPAQTQELTDGAEPAASEGALTPEAAPEPDEADKDVQLGAVANVDADATPAVVPFPLRKPTLRAAVENDKPAKAARAANAARPKRVITYRPRSRAPAKSKGFLGGRRATSMPEYPFAAGP